MDLKAEQQLKILEDLKAKQRLKILEIEQQLKLLEDLKVEQQLKLFEIEQQLQNLNIQLNTTKLDSLENKILSGSNRKIFHLDKENDIFAGGVLLYKIINNNFYLLLSFSSFRQYYEDIGGKVDLVDDSIYDTVIRETQEETNNVINLTKSRLESSNYIYNRSGKYMLFLTEANDIEKNKTINDFGMCEIHDNINRTIQWINYDDILKNNLKLSPRILFKFIAKEIEKNQEI